MLKRPNPPSLPVLAGGAVHGAGGAVHGAGGNVPQGEASSLATLVPPVNVLLIHVIKELVGGHRAHGGLQVNCRNMYLFLLTFTYSYFLPIFIYFILYCCCYVAVEEPSIIIILLCTYNTIIKVYLNPNQNRSETPEPFRPHTRTVTISRLRWEGRSVFGCD